MDAPSLSLCGRLADFAGPPDEPRDERGRWTAATQAMMAAHPTPAGDPKPPAGLFAQGPEHAAYAGHVAAVHRARLARGVHHLLTAPPDPAARTAGQAVERVRAAAGDLKLFGPVFAPHHAAVAAAHPEGRQALDAAHGEARRRHAAAVEAARAHVEALPEDRRAKARRALDAAFSEGGSMRILAEFDWRTQDRAPAGTPEGGQWVSEGHASTAGESWAAPVRVYSARPHPPTAQETAALSSHLNSLTVAQLSRLAHEHGLTSGTKRDLVASLTQRIREKRPTAAAYAPTARTPTTLHKEPPAPSQGSEKARGEAVRKAAGSYMAGTANVQRLAGIAEKHDAHENAIREAEAQGVLDRRAEATAERTPQGMGDAYLRRLLASAYPAQAVTPGSGQGPDLTVTATEAPHPAPIVPAGPQLDVDALEKKGDLTAMLAEAKRLGIELPKDSAGKLDKLHLLRAIRDKVKAGDGDAPPWRALKPSDEGVMKSARDAGTIPTARGPGRGTELAKPQAGPPPRTGLPELKGTPAQIPFAGGVRGMKLREAEAHVQRREGAKHPDAADDRKALEHLRKEDRAGWWLDRRHKRAEELLDEVYQRKVAAFTGDGPMDGEERYGRLVAAFADDGEGHWVTIGAHGEEGDRHGGTPVFIKDGKITKGPGHMVGKSPDQLGKKVKQDHGPLHPHTGTREGPAEKSAPPKAEGGGELVARTEKRERADVDKGEIYSEYRVRHLPQAEREKMYYDRSVQLPLGHTHALEKRTIRTGEGGSEGPWEFYHSGTSAKEAVAAHMGSSDYAEAESLHPLHEQAKAKKAEGRRLMEAVTQAKRHAEGAAESVYQHKRHIEGLYSKALGKAGGDAAKEEQIRQRYLKKYKPEYERMQAEAVAAAGRHKEAEEAFEKHVGKKGSAVFAADPLALCGRFAG